MNQTTKTRIEKINNGEVPEGYEKVSFGVFPCDWENNKKLKDIGLFGKGKGIPGDKMKTYGVPCVGYGDLYMKYNLHFEKAQCFVDEQVAKESQPIKTGTLLFTGTGETAEEIGKCVCYNGLETIYAGGDIITFVLKEINPMFLAYQQNIKFSLVEKSRFGQGHSVVHIQQNELSKLSAAYPTSSQEQAKIAEILMKWDEMVEAQDSYIKALELRKKALMQKLLTSTKGWRSKKMGELCNISTGSKNTQDKEDDGLYNFFVRSSAIEHINSYSFEGEAILIPGDGNIGSIFHYINDKFEYHQRVYKISNCKSILLKYVYYYLQQHLKKRVMSLSAKATVDSLRMEMLTEMNIYYNDQQQQIANILTTADEEVQLQKQKLDKIKRQRKSLQQLLLTGIVRVNYA